MKRRDVLHKIVIGTGAIFALSPAIVSCSEEADTILGGNNGNGNGIPIEIDLEFFLYRIKKGWGVYY